MTIVMMVMKTRKCRMRSACELKNCVVPAFGIVSIYFNLHPILGTTVWANKGASKSEEADWETVI